MDFVSLQLTYENRGSPSNEIGITYLSLVWGGCKDETSININPILTKYCNTLEQLDLDTDLDNDDNDNTFDVYYPRLKKLFLNTSAWWILRKAPTLEEMTITSRAIRIHFAGLDTIPPHLYTLEFRLAREPYLVDK